MAVSEKSVGTKRSPKSAGNGTRKSAASQKTGATETKTAGHHLPEGRIHWIRSMPIRTTRHLKLGLLYLPCCFFQCFYISHALGWLEV